MSQWEIWKQVFIVFTRAFDSKNSIQISALCDVGRLEDTIPVLQSIIKYDEPDLRVKQTFSFDVIAKVKEAFDKCDNADLKLEFDRIYDILQSQGHISEEVSVRMFVFCCE